jgi:hypothetical protein
VTGKPLQIAVERDGHSGGDAASASSLPMYVRLHSRCSANADALTVAGFLDRGRSMVTVSAIVFVLVASRQETPIAASAWMERVMEQSFT